MDISVLKKDTLQVWVPFGDDAEVLIRYLPREELQKIYNKAKKITYRNHQKVEEFDSLEADKLLGHAAVKDWKGFVMDGSPFPCTPENITLVMTKWNAFSRFVNEACVDLETLAKEEREQIVKNSSTTSGQS